MHNPALAIPAQGAASSAQRDQAIQSIRAIGHAYHIIDLERGVRRNGQLSAGHIHKQIDTMRVSARQEHRSQGCQRGRNAGESLLDWYLHTQRLIKPFGGEVDETCWFPGWRLVSLPYTFSHFLQGNLLDARRCASRS